MAVNEAKTELIFTQKGSNPIKITGKMKQALINFKNKLRNKLKTSPKEVVKAANKEEYETNVRVKELRKEIRKIEKKHKLTKEDELLIEQKEQEIAKLKERLKDLKFTKMSLPSRKIWFPFTSVEEMQKLKDFEKDFNKEVLSQNDEEEKPTIQRVEATQDKPEPAQKDPKGENPPHANPEPTEDEVQPVPKPEEEHEKPKEEEKHEKNDNKLEPIREETREEKPTLNKATVTPVYKNLNDLKNFETYEEYLKAFLSQSKTKHEDMFVQILDGNLPEGLLKRDEFNMRKENDALKEKIAQTEKENNELKDANKELAKENEKNEKKVKELNRLNDDLMTQNSQQQEQITDLEEEKDKLETEKQEKETAIKSKDETINELNSQKETAQKENEALKKSSQDAQKSYEETIEKQNQEIEKLKKENEKILAELNGLTNGVKNLMAAINGAQQNNNPQTIEEPQAPTPTPVDETINEEPKPAFEEEVKPIENEKPKRTVRPSATLKTENMLYNELSSNLQTILENGGFTDEEKNHLDNEIDIDDIKSQMEYVKALAEKKSSENPDDLTHELENFGRTR